MSDEAPAPDDDRDALLVRAERIGDLPLGERPDALDGLNRAVVTELQALEDADGRRGARPDDGRASTHRR